MEITITKKLFMTVDIDVPEDVTDEVLSKEIQKIVNLHEDLDEWERYNWLGKEVYEAYDNYSGTEIELDF